MGSFLFSAVSVGVAAEAKDHLHSHSGRRIRWPCKWGGLWLTSIWRTRLNGSPLPRQRYSFSSLFGPSCSQLSRVFFLFLFSFSLSFFFLHACPLSSSVKGTGTPADARKGERVSRCERGNQCSVPALAWGAGWGVTIQSLFKHPREVLQSGDTTNFVWPFSTLVSLGVYFLFFSPNVIRPTDPLLQSRTTCWTSHEDKVPRDTTCSGLTSRAWISTTNLCTASSSPTSETASLIFDSLCPLKSANIL